MIVAVVAFDEGQIVVVGMAAMAEADPCHELVRLGNLVDGLEIAAAIDKGESLPRAVGPLGDDRHVLGRPGVARARCACANAAARRPRTPRSQPRHGRYRCGGCPRHERGHDCG